MNDIPIPTSLRNAPRAPATQAELESMRAKVWLDQGLVVINPDEIMDDFVRQGLINEATRKFGRRMRK